MSNKFDTLNEGIEAARAGQIDRARDRLQAALELDPRSVLALLWLAHVEDSVETRIGYLRRALELQPSNEHALAGLKSALFQAGVALVHRGRLDEARSALEEASVRDPGNVHVWLWLAAATKDAGSKRRCLERALELDPSQADAKRLLSELDRRSTPAWRCLVCDAAGAESPVRCPQCGAVVGVERAQEATKGGGDEPRLRAFVEQHARSVLNGNVELHLALGLATLQLGHPGPAREHFDNALSLAPGNEAIARAVELAVSLQNPTQAPEAETATVADAVDEEKPPRPEVLVVDDSATVRKIVAVTLEKHGFSVSSAVNGMQALASLKRSIPAVILLDIGMPQMDGYQICKLIRANVQTSAVPVVMLSGKDGMLDKMRARIAGFTDYVTKPFEPSALLSIVEKHCHSYG